MPQCPEKEGISRRTGRQVHGSAVLVQRVQARALAADKGIAGEALRQFAVEADQRPVGIPVFEQMEGVPEGVVVIEASFIGEESRVLVETQHAHANTAPLVQSIQHPGILFRLGIEYPRIEHGIGHQTPITARGGGGQGRVGLFLPVKQYIGNEGRVYVAPHAFIHCPENRLTIPFHPVFQRRVRFPHLTQHRGHIAQATPAGGIGLQVPNRHRNIRGIKVLRRQAGSGIKVVDKERDQGFPGGTVLLHKPVVSREPVELGQGAQFPARYRVLVLRYGMAQQGEEHGP
ncbi:MAG: hypothetical protein BWX80_04125 [Candidatus Hydrogenedentes bacterium ADurb.Bin101]|nr:MAG: hypothetical protein BWX80_04125 [Candidatus Hydrogenedentes bacterium ADurb.Bin101]